MCHAPSDWDKVWLEGDTSGVSEHVHPALEVFTQLGRGRGVRVSSEIRAGELLLAERAVATAPEPKLAKVLHDLQASLEQPLRGRLASLCHGVEPPALREPVPLAEWPPAGYAEVEGSTVPLDRLRRMVDLNSYRCSPAVSEYMFIPEDDVPDDEATRHQTYGVFLLGSLVNHSCSCNAAKVLLNDWVFLRAARDLTVGEELTQFYCDIRMPHRQRQQELKDLFGFSCDCERCAFEERASRFAGEALEPWRSLYSCCVPAHPSVRVSHLEAVVSHAMSSVQGLRRSKDFGLTKVQEQWLMWPIVPAISQLAGCLRRDGRADDAADWWRLAEAATACVVPVSNIHVRCMAEWLLTLAESGGEADAVESALEASMRTVALGYGGGLAVWQRCVGFRMPAHVQRLAEKLARAQARIRFEWALEESVRGKLTLWSEAFDSLENVHVDASAREIVVAAPGVEELRVACPFAIDVQSAQVKLRARKRRIEVTVEKAAP